ncbi:NfeD family protein [Morganella morganii subsp. morganii]|uniref:NfeD family protein n=1 Tax=Morganella morganii TaxID=582 RepID=UPI001BDA6E46|nr:NfeD family protein [Morganella morganii]MBT0351356.1 NfeD family protein [Morganella morganii subsp. morganii]
MIEMIASQAVWFWLCFGGILLILEMLGTGGYLLWSGVAALVVALLVWIMPGLSLEWQGIIFAVMTVICAVLWRNFQRRRQRNDSSSPNQVNHKLISLRAALLAETEDGYSRIRLADGSWRVYSQSALPAGTEVEVIAVDGITLTVRAVSR